MSVHFTNNLLIAFVYNDVINYKALNRCDIDKRFVNSIENSKNVLR